MHNLPEAIFIENILPGNQNLMEAIKDSLCLIDQLVNEILHPRVRDRRWTKGRLTVKELNIRVGQLRHVEIFLLSVKMFIICYRKSSKKMPKTTPS